MGLINAKAFRDFRSIPTHAAAIVLALIVVMTMPAGLEMALQSLAQGRDRFTKELALADLEIRMLPEDIRNLPSWRDVPGIDRVESRLLMPGTIELPNGKTIAALTVFLRNSAPEVNRIRLQSGRMFHYGASEEAVIERSLETYGHVGKGQTIRVAVGHKTYEHRITGVVTSPEFLIVAANPEYFLPEKGSLAVVYTSLDRVFQSLGFTMVNDLAFTFKPGANIDATKRAILAKLGGRTIERVIPKAQHLSIKHIDFDREIFGIFQPAIVIVLSLLAACLVLINVDRLVRRQQKEIGALLALGYWPLSVVASYLLASLALSIVGIAGGTLGAIGFRDAFLGIYTSAHGLAYVEHHVYASVLARGAGYAVLVALLSTCLACRRLFRATPLSLMRPAPPAFASASSLFLVTARLAARFSLGVQLGVRNIVRHHRLTWTTATTVGLALAVSIAYWVCLDSMSEAVSRSFSDQKWDRVVSFLYPTLEDDLQPLSTWSGVDRVEPFIRAQGQLITTKRNLDISVLGLRPQGSLRSVRLIAGRMASDEGEVVLSEDTARRLSLSVGSSTTLQLRNQQYPVRVVGIKTDVLLGETLLSLAWVRKALELEDQATGAFVSFSPQADLKQLDRQIGQLEFAGRSTPRNQLVDEFRTVLQDIRKLVILVALIALTVAALFIVVSMSMTMSERAGEFAMLRAMGYETQLIRQVVTTEAIIQVSLALLISAPMSYALALVLNARAGQAWFAQPTVYSPKLFAAIACGVMVVTIISLLGPIRELRKTNLMEGLRARVIE